MSWHKSTARPTSNFSLNIFRTRWMRISTNSPMNKELNGTGDIRTLLCLILFILELMSLIKQFIILLISAILCWAAISEVFTGILSIRSDNYNQFHPSNRHNNKHIASSGDYHLD